MTEHRNGEAQPSPTEEAIHGTVQKIIQEGNKKTYVIVFKPNDPTSKPVKKVSSRPQFTNKKGSDSDALKKNLTDINDDNYDSHKSALDLFLDDEGSIPWPDDGEQVTLPKKIHAPQNEGVNLNLHDSGIQAITTPSNSSSQFPPKHSVVRQIVLDSPNFSTTPEQQRFNSVVRFLNEDSNPSPLASSTPIGSSSVPMQAQESPDSGIYSASSSILSQVMTTPELPNNNNNDNNMVFTKLLKKEDGNDDIPSSQEEGESKLDTSLANIHWLEGFTLKEDKEEVVKEPQHVINRMSMEDKCRRKPFELEEVERICRECGKLQRPPYSYMVLIQLALSSAEDNKMTLKEICKWIEDKFEYFKSIAKPGWKNSIRHNLSFYQCFARDLSNNKKHGSKWMLKFDPADLPKDIPDRVPVISAAAINYCQSMTQPGLYPMNMMPVNMLGQNMMFPQLMGQYPIQSVNKSVHTSISHGVMGMGSGGLYNKKRKSSVPMPILPRPASLQAYALVPLQSLQQQAGHHLPTIPNTNRPIIVHVPNNNMSHKVTAPQPQYQLIKNTQQPSNPVVNIAPLPTDDRVSLVEQAWLDAQCGMSDDQEELQAVTIPFQEKPVISNTFNQTEQILQANKKQKVKSGLPVPTIYDNQRKVKRTRSRVKKSANQICGERNLLDSSDSECEVDNDTSDLPTPIRQLFSDTPNKKTSAMSTSTPVRNSVVSSDHLPSPIRGLTPVRYGHLFDGSFLDMIQEEVFASLTGSPRTTGAIANQGSPNNISLSEFGIFRTPNKMSGKSPTGCDKSPQDSHGQSLCRFLADFPIDSNIIEEVDGFPGEISLNWSTQQTDIHIDKK